ncbi:MAG: hypothetical protein ACLFPF_03670 [Halanaerobiales bacterium]
METQRSEKISWSNVGCAFVFILIFQLIAVFLGLVVFINMSLGLILTIVFAITFAGYILLGYLNPLIEAQDLIVALTIISFISTTFQDGSSQLGLIIVGFIIQLGMGLLGLKIGNKIRDKEEAY